MSQNGNIVGLNKLNNVLNIIQEKIHIAPKDSILIICAHDYRLMICDRDLKSILEKFISENLIQKISFTTYPVTANIYKIKVLLLNEFNDFCQKIQIALQEAKKDKKDELIEKITEEKVVLLARINELESSQWEFDPDDKETYAELLDIANQAHRATCNNRDPTQTFKQQGLAYLDRVHPDTLKLGKNAREAIAFIINPVKSKQGGGQKKSPSST